jgi:hypothetical protein
MRAGPEGTARPAFRPPLRFPCAGQKNSLLLRLGKDLKHKPFLTRILPQKRRVPCEFAATQGIFVLSLRSWAAQNGARLSRSQ